MSTDMTFSSPVIALIDSDDDFCDDIFVKPSGKTLRKIYNFNYVADPEMYYYRDVNGTFVPTTDADVSLKFRDVCLNTYTKPTNSRNSFSFYGKSISLRNHGLFNTVFDELEKHCISKKTVSNMRSGTDITEYVLPVTGHVDSATLYQEDIYNPIACPKKQNVKQNVKQKKQQPARRRKIRSWKYYEAQKTKADNSRYIRVNGNMYSVDNVYKRSGTDFVPVVIHKKFDESILNAHNQFVRNRLSVGTTALTISFIKDTSITGFVLEPEPMKFEYVYEDVDARRSQRRGRGFIKCLVNDPGFITKFELSYRSTLTDGQWIKYNIFDGNDNNHSPTKIVFDEEIMAKEIRIIPLTYVNSFEKVIVTPFTTIISEEKKDENETVTYYIETTNRPSSVYTYAPDVLCWGSSYWRRHNYKKGDKKIKQREFRELCNL
jgi:hypothetical protein